MTNADRIRKMTDEELCRFLIMVENNDLHYDALSCGYCELVDTSDCDKCVKKWLKRNANKERGLNKIFTTE